MLDIIRILLVDAHPLNHTAIQTILEDTNDLHLVASITNIKQIEKSIQIYAPISYYWHQMLSNLRPFNYLTT